MILGWWGGAGTSSSRAAPAGSGAHQRRAVVALLLSTPAGHRFPGRAALPAGCACRRAHPRTIIIIARAYCIVLRWCCCGAISLQQLLIGLGADQLGSRDHQIICPECDR
jgi:hypothetical protein